MSVVVLFFFFSHGTIGILIQLLSSFGPPVLHPVRGCSSRMHRILQSVRGVPKESGGTTKKAESAVECPLPENPAANVKSAESCRIPSLRSRSLGWSKLGPWRPLRPWRTRTSCYQCILQGMTRTSMVPAHPEHPCRPTRYQSFKWP